MKVEYRGNCFDLSGHFDLPDVSWDPLFYDYSGNSQLMLAIVFSCDLSQIVLKCTRITDRCRSIFSLETILFIVIEHIRTRACLTIILFISLVMIL